MYGWEWEVNSVGPSLSGTLLLASLAGADSTRNRAAAHEPAPLRLTGGHGYDDAPQ